MKILKSSALYSGQPVRALLEELGYQAMSVDNRITLGLIFAASTKSEGSEEARRQSHLTNATPQDFQIRFPLRDRIKRSLVKLAADVVAKHRHQLTDISVHVAEDDFISRCFFAELPQISLAFFTPKLTPAEAGILAQPPAVLARQAHDRLYAGDYGTAYRLLISVADNERSDTVNYMLGLCTNFFGQTEESELHFRRLLISANPLSRVQSSYVLSMLYLRMHARDRQNLAVAETLLEDAYRILIAHPEVDDAIFHGVFNRNGYALCLFRRGKIKEALTMLESGIAKLNRDRSGARALHRSVLIYNAVQCLRALGRYQACERKCEQLIAIDPLMPEYRLEQARVYLDQKKYSLAFQSLSHAVNIDAYIPEAFALQGYCHFERGDLESAALSYEKASSLDPQSATHLLDLGYCLSELNRKQELGSALDRLQHLNLTAEEQAATHALSIEAEVCA